MAVRVGWLVGILSLFAVQLMAATRPYYLQVQDPLDGWVSVQLIDKASGTPIEPLVLFNASGALALSFELDGQPLIQSQWGPASTLGLASVLSEDQKTLHLPVTLPTEVTTQGNKALLRLTLTHPAVGHLGWTHGLPLDDLQVLAAELGAQQASELMALLQTNRVTPAQIDSLLAKLASPIDDNPCVTYFESVSGLLKSDDAHCATSASGLLAPVQFDSLCQQTTQRQLKDLGIVAQLQCPIDAAIARVVAPSQHQRVKDQISSQWQTRLADAPAKTLTWQEVGRLLVRWAPARDSDVAGFAYYVNQLAEQRSATAANQRWLVNQTTFRDTLMSELIRASVTQHFKERQTFAQWCAERSLRSGAADLCFQFATDLAVRLVTVFGFEQLPAFNQSVSNHREAYVRWVTSVVGRTAADHSMDFLTQWSIQYATEQFQADQCGPQQLFPLGALMSKDRLPDLDLLANPQSSAYLASIDQMAGEFERFIQSLWTRMGGVEGADYRRASTCAEKTLETPAFRQLLPQ